MDVGESRHDGKISGSKPVITSPLGSGRSPRSSPRRIGSRPEAGQMFLLNRQLLRAFFFLSLLVLTLIHISLLCQVGTKGVAPITPETGWKEITFTRQQANATDAAYAVLREYTALAKSFAGLLNVTSRPTSSNPFFFFHLRDTGAEPMVHTIDATAAWAELNRYIPCITWSCQPSDVHPDKERWNNTEVYASHVNFVQAENLVRIVRRLRHVATAADGSTPDFENNYTPRNPRSSQPFSCVVTVRPTVERVFSCLNQRGKPAHKLAPSDLDTLLPTSYSKEKVGCNNEMVRGFGTHYGNETTTNTMRIINEDGSSNWDAVRELEAIISRLSSCIITKIDRCEETWEILSHYVPWLGESFQCTPPSIGNGETGGPSKFTHTSHEVTSLILRHNVMDEYIYRFADELYRHQLIAAREARGRDPSGKRPTRPHPDAGARDENGTWGFVADPTSASRSFRSRYYPGAKLRMSDLPMDAKTTKQVCDKPPGQGLERGQGGYEMLSNWVRVGSNASDSLSGEGGDAPRILCIVYTYGADKARDRVRSIIETWGHRCDGFLAASTETDPDLGAVDLPHIGPEIYDNMWQKIRSIWRYVHANYIDQYEYFHICGDDAYIIVENLRDYLWTASGGRSDGGGNYPLYAGSWARSPDPRMRKRPGYYIMGGSGYTLNRESLRRFTMHRSCGQYLRTSAEDRMIAMCLGELGIAGNDTRDAAGSQRYLNERPNSVYLFHPENYTIHPYVVHQFRWYEEMGFRPRLGLRAASRDAVAFHKMKSPNEMRRVHAILYRSCPTGTILGDVLE